jgi:hypothetical protein
MNAAKQQYLQVVRSNTAYPVYRGFVATVALLWFVLAGMIGLFALLGGMSMLSTSTLLGVGIIINGGVVAAILFMLARLAKEASLMLADLADSTVDANKDRVSH